MSISEKEVIKIAKLARIAISDQEKPIFAKELSKILETISELQEVNTDNVARMTSVLSNSLKMRPDIVSKAPSIEQIMQNAPIAKYNCFVVPKVIE